jgi:hypothetical protein
MILDLYSVNWLVRLIVGRIGKVWRDVVKTLIISGNQATDHQAFHSLIINPLIIRLFPYLDYHEPVILQKTSLKVLILIIKSTYQG